MKKNAKSTAKASAPTDQYMQTMLAGVTEKLTLELREVLTKTLEQQISETLAQALLEGEFYRRISKDMRSGLRKIHKEISNASKVESAQGVAESARTNQLFSETSRQLTEVLSQTEEATVTIMEVVERQFVNQEKVTALYQRLALTDNSEALSELEAVHAELDIDLNAILMALSFQDLTGQRIKRAVSALREIESTVVELYLSTGLLIQAHEETPVKDLDALAAQTRETVEAFASQSLIGSDLKGPDRCVGQAKIDDLLKQLGMD